jgi:hypothetical protein
MTSCIRATEGQGQAILNGLVDVRSTSAPKTAWSPLKARLAKLDRDCGPRGWASLPGSHGTVSGSNSYFIVGMTNSAPSFTPDGQREVTVLVLV